MTSLVPTLTIVIFGLGTRLFVRMRTKLLASFPGSSAPERDIEVVHATRREPGTVNFNCVRTPAALRVIAA